MKPDRISSEPALLKVLAIVLFSLHGVTGRSVEGSYLARLMNDQPIPAELRLPATAGDTRLFRLEQGLLRLSAGGRFTLYFRYYHQLVPRGHQPIKTPVLSESETGTFKVIQDRIVLTPLRKQGAKARPTVTATIVGDEIRAVYTLETVGTRKRITLSLKRDPRYW